MWTPPPPHTHTHTPPTSYHPSSYLYSGEKKLFLHTRRLRVGEAAWRWNLLRHDTHTHRFCDTQSLFAVNNYCARNISVTDKYTVNTNTQRKTHENTVFHRNTKTIYPTLLGSRTVFISNSVKHHGGETHLFLFFLFLKAGFSLQHSGATDTGSCSEFNQSRKRVHPDRDSDA